MKVWTDKEGKKLTAKEFSERFKSGVEKITPAQQLKVSMIGYIIVLVGIILGLGINIYAKIWWLVIILSGSLIISGMAALGNYQKLIALRKLEEQMKEIESQEVQLPVFQGGGV